MAVSALPPDLHLSGQEEVHRRRCLALFDEVGAGWKPFDIDEIGRISERCRLTREDRQGPDEVLRAFEALRQLDDPLGQTVAQEHPASRQVAVEEPDRCARSHLVAGGRDGCAHGYVVCMTGESVWPEGDHHIRIDLADQLRSEPDQNLAVDLGESAVWMVETSGLGEPELDSGRSELLLPHCSQG